ncbi:MAG: metal-sensitive transcriptional regulator [Planctomycetota bacterium]|jgi:DNA-binding FrmR family transcriptional regulator
MTNAKDVTGHYHYTQEKEALITRMRRIEGQAKGIEKMIEEDRYCIDIVQQINALSSAADEVGLIILQNHIEGCVTDAIREQRGEDYIKELMATIRKAMKR